MTALAHTALVDPFISQPTTTGKINCNDFPQKKVANNQTNNTALIPQDIAANYQRAKTTDITIRPVRKLTIIETLVSGLKTAGCIITRFVKLIQVYRAVKKADKETLAKKLAELKGGPIIKFFQLLANSHRMGIDIMGEEKYNTLKSVLTTTTSTNPKISDSEIFELFNRAKIPYSKENIRQRTNLGTGSVAGVEEVQDTENNKEVYKLVPLQSEIRMNADIFNLKLVLHVVGFFNKGLNVGVKKMILDFIRSINEEKDLHTEANNISDMKQALELTKELSEKPDKCFNNKHFKDFTLPPKYNDKITFELTDSKIPNHKKTIEVNYKTPEIIPQKSTDRTLAMKKIDGATLDDTPENLDKLRQIMRQLFNIDDPSVVISENDVQRFRLNCKTLAYDMWSDCYTKTGFFNADMHSGNLMICIEDGKLSIYFIDLGNVCQSTARQVIATYQIKVLFERCFEPSGSDKQSQRKEAVDALISNLKEFSRDSEAISKTRNWQGLEDDFNEFLITNDKNREAHTEYLKNPQAKVAQAPKYIKSKDGTEKHLSFVIDMAAKYGIFFTGNIIALVRAQTLLNSHKKELISKMGTPPTQNP